MKKVTDSDLKLYINDNGGRRSGIEGRSFTYNVYIAERRSGVDRRSGNDRRLKPRK